MARLFYNLVQGNLGADLTVGGTTITLAAALQEGGVNVPTITGSDIIVLRIDSEIVHLTAYTAGATTGTILRAQGSTVAATHVTGAVVRHVATKTDLGLDAHVTDTSAAHAASAVSVNSATLVGTGTDVQAVFEELDNAIVAAEAATAAHLADTADAHDASAISILDTANDFAATDVEGALAELQADAEADATGLSDHLADTADAHDASAISVLDTAGNFTATDVEGVLAELPGTYVPLTATAKPTGGTVSLRPRAVLQFVDFVGGLDANDGLSMGSAKKTIAAAMTGLAGAPGLVQLLGGGYSQAGPVLIPHNGVRLRGDTRSGTDITVTGVAGTNGLEVIGTAGSHLFDVTIEHLHLLSTNGSGVGIKASYSDRMRINHCRTEGFGIGQELLTCILGSMDDVFNYNISGRGVSATAGCHSWTVRGWTAGAAQYGMWIDQSRSWDVQGDIENASITAIYLDASTAAYYAGHSFHGMYIEGCGIHGLRIGVTNAVKGVSFEGSYLEGGAATGYALKLDKVDGLWVSGVGFDTGWTSGDDLVSLGDVKNFNTRANTPNLPWAGHQTPAYAATITPDLDYGPTVEVGELTGNVTIAAPLNPVTGARMTFLFAQDATGGRTVTWTAASGGNAAFKRASMYSDTGNTASTQCNVSWIFDGTYWRLDSQQGWT